VIRRISILLSAFALSVAGCGSDGATGAAQGDAADAVDAHSFGDAGGGGIPSQPDTSLDAASDVDVDDAADAEEPDTGPDALEEPDAADVPDGEPLEDVDPGCGPVGSACNDGDPCTVNDQCLAGGACAGVAVDCSDGVPCTVDTCEQGACAHTVQASFCHIDGICWTDGQPHPTEPCLACDAGVGGEAWTPLPDTPCDDGDLCTANDVCTALGCEGTPLDCDDADPCTVGDACTSGKCVPGPLKDADEDGAADQACGGTDCDDAAAAVHPGAPEACDDGKDNDCNGQTDLGDTACLATCTFHTDCYPEQLCGQHPLLGKLVCSDPCTTSSECGAGEVCAHVPGSANLGYCRPTSNPSGALNGQPCGAASQCQTELCAGVCLDSCSDQAACTPFGTTCTAAGDAQTGLQGVCAPANLVPGGKANGASCTSASQCISGLCDLLAAVPTCVPLCSTDADCALTQECNLTTRTNGPLGNSVSFDPAYTAKTYDAALGCYARKWPSGNLGTGAACTQPSQCRSNKCFALLPTSAQQWCTTYCGSDLDCPPDMQCKPDVVTLVSHWFDQAGLSLPGGTTLVRVCKWK
jgi:hypothetical protein